MLSYVYHTLHTFRKAFTRRCSVRLTYSTPMAMTARR